MHGRHPIGLLEMEWIGPISLRPSLAWEDLGPPRVLWALMGLLEPKDTTMYVRVRKGEGAGQGGREGGRDDLMEINELFYFN